MRHRIFILFIYNKARGHVSSRFQKMMYRPTRIRPKVFAIKEWTSSTKHDLHLITRFFLTTFSFIGLRAKKKKRKCKRVIFGILKFIFFALALSTISNLSFLKALILMHVFSDRTTTLDSIKYRPATQWHYTLPNFVINT